MKFGMATVVLILIWVAAPVWSADPTVRAWLDRDTLQMGETATLNVEAQGETNAQPDFTPLQQDFNLQGTQSSQQVSITNGQTTAKILWAVVLDPKHEGHFTVPAIAVGNAHTEPLSLTVLPAPSGAQGHSGDDIFIEASAEPLAPYVQQQVRYTVKLFFAVNLADGNLDDPRANGLSVQKLGQDKRYTAERGDRRYQVIERHYALTPESNGVVHIPAIVFRGHAINNTDPSGFFGRGGRAVSASSDAIDLRVKPKPADWGDAPWLPAAALSLTEEGELPSQVHLGDPVTRTLRVQAQGLSFEQLPEFNLPTPEGAQVYPDKSVTQTRDDGEWVYGERTRKFAFVATRTGKLILPAIRLRWWDTQHERAEMVELPSKEIEVLPATGTNAKALSDTSASPMEGSTSVSPASQAPAAPSVNAVDTASDQNASLWQWIAALGFSLWLLTVALWCWIERRKRLALLFPGNNAALPTFGNAKIKFENACTEGNLDAAGQALLAWAREQYPDLHNLGELAARLGNTEQSALITEIEHTRFGNAEANDLTTRLHQAFAKGIGWSHIRCQGAMSPLPELY